MTIAWPLYAAADLASGTAANHVGVLAASVFDVSGAGGGDGGGFVAERFGPDTQSSHLG